MSLYAVKKSKVNQAEFKGLVLNLVVQAYCKES